MKNTYRLALAGLLASTAILAACGAGAKAGPAGTPTIEPSATPTGFIIIEPEPPTPTSVPAPGSTLVPGKQKVAPAESPRVLWVRSSHAGPGVVTIRFETNVPVVGEVRVMTNQVGPEYFHSVFSTPVDSPAMDHTVSVPANAFGRYVVRATDGNGKVAWATLRYKSDLNGIDWATGANAPELTATTPKSLAIEWAFPNGHPTKKGFEGSVRVFSTDAGCTTADSCVGDFVGEPIKAEAIVNGILEGHEATATIPGAPFDYQVIVGQPLAPDNSSMVFIQLEIRGDQLPQTKPQGPTDIKSAN